MSDPLSVAASVVGLMTAGKEILELLWKTSSAVAEASSSVAAASNEVNATAVILAQLRGFIDGKSYAPQQRLTMITIEQIGATLTGCVLTYSDLSRILKKLHADTGMRPLDRARWVLEKEKVETLVQRLVNHKTGFSLMLNILQCGALQDAADFSRGLIDSMNALHRTQGDVFDRLAAMEQDSSEIRSILSRTGTSSSNLPSRPTTLVSPENTAKLQASRAVPRKSSSILSSPRTTPEVPRGADDGGTSLSTPKLESTSIPYENQPSSEESPFDFEQVLNNSHVYKHVPKDSSRFSMITGESQSMVLSMCSCITLGQVSNLAFVAIPVYATDVSNSDCYQFGQTEVVSSSVKSVTQWPRNKFRLRANTPSPSRIMRQASRTLSGPPRPLDPSSWYCSAPIVFGTRLSLSLQYASSSFRDIDRPFGILRIPLVVATCDAELRKQAAGVEDIFVGPWNISPDYLDFWNTQFSKPEFSKRAFSINYREAAFMLLHFLARLDDPLVPDEQYEAFCAPVQGLDFDDGIPGAREHVVTEYNGLIGDLPTVNRHLLLFLLHLLAFLADLPSPSKMTVRRLANLFRPFILRAPETVPAPTSRAFYEYEKKHNRSQNSLVVRTLIECEHLLDVDVTKSSLYD